MKADAKAEEDRHKIETAALKALNTALQAEKQTALDKAAAEAAGRTKAEKERDAAIALTKALTDDALSGAINLRIGAGQSKPMASGVFSFTRPGTESTLNIFIAGETAVTARDSALRESANNKTALDKCEEQRKNDAKVIEDGKAEIKTNKAGWKTADDNLAHLEHSILGTKIKTFAIGVGVGAAIIEGLKLLGIIK
jgi:hypothetical protein